MPWWLYRHNSLILHMNKKPQVSETYNKLFQEGGSGGVFDMHYRRSGYYPLFRAIEVAVRSIGAKQVLEVGCGTGQMAHLLMDRNSVNYQGFDFSELAIEKARRRTGRTSSFAVADATVSETYSQRQYDAIICTEVLEHLENDLAAIAHWRSGTNVVCSVPNYDADTHVRFFKNESEVTQRYGELIEIQSIRRLRKPFLNDLHWRNWLRAVRWNRYRPDRLKWLFGFTDFDRDGGWFVFVGRKR
jgi:2-polyprenyl-3-methyl-5-hydroxy-6-metoxy-1,4-benzoquinol methylase